MPRSGLGLNELLGLRSVPDEDKRIIEQRPAWQIDAAEWRGDKHDAWFGYVDRPHFRGRKDDQLYGGRSSAVLQQD